MRYLLFGGNWYYPSGGMNDLITDSDDYVSLIQKAEQLMKPDENGIGEIDWYHIWDKERKEIPSQSLAQPNWK